MLVQKVSDKWIVILDKDQKVVETLTAIVKKENIRGGFLTGIGALKNVELGFYHLEQKDYHRKTFESGDYELIALNGNISLKDEQAYVHVHTAIGDEEFNVFGGHMFEAVVAVTAEIHIVPLGAMPERQLQDKLGLATIVRCKI